MKLIAYLDPGTGSFIAQAVIGGAAGVAILVKAKGKQLFGKKKQALPAEEQPVADTAEVDAAGQPE